MSGTSPTCGWAAAGSSTWPRSWICVRVGWWAGRSPITCAPSSSSTRSKLRHTLAAAAWTGWCFTATNGAQYCSREFARACRRFGVIRSRGAVGTSAYNAAAESFNASLKRETLKGAPGRPDARTARAARLAVFGWITRYNTVRRQSRLGQLSPIAYEKTADGLKSVA
ncbi:hypothetical protein GCM10010176_088550 [Nonomuraea spiralis]|nr:hypothetical protein GCM10010176_088550 [Nonomuraea spiralis]